MKPMHFVVLALLALVSSAVAIASYAANNTWSQVKVAGSRMFPTLNVDASKVTTVEVQQGGKAITLERKDGAWRVKERDGYPAAAEKVRALMVSMAEADLVDAKTRVPDRYGLLDLEDPTGKDAKSRGVRLLDGNGAVIAEAVLGKKRADAFGVGKVGTYVRKADDVQTWLANVELDPSADLKDWIKTDVFQTESGKVQRVTVEVPGEQPLKFERNADKKMGVVGIPTGQKLKEEGAPEGMARAVASIDLDDVRKLAAAPAGKDVSTVKVEVDGGLVVTLRVRKDDKGQWLSLSATGEGDAKKTADELNQRTAGWEYKITQNKADALLKKRADLFDKAS